MNSHLASDGAVLEDSVEGLMGTWDDRIIRMECSFRRCAVGDLWRPRKVLPHRAFPEQCIAMGCSALLLAIDLECALDKNLAERKGQAVDRQHCGRPRSPLMHHERERYIRPCAETRDIGCPGQRRGVLLHAGAGHLAGHVHRILRKLTVSWSGTGRGRRECQTVQLTRNFRARAFGVKGYRGDHRNEVRRSCPTMDDGRAGSSRDSPVVIV